MLPKISESCKVLEHKRNTIDPCVFFKWTNLGMLLMCSWIDDYLIVGNRADVLTAKKEFADAFECEDDGEMKEHVGCKITQTDDSMVITQPVLVQQVVQLGRHEPDRLRVVNMGRCRQMNVTS